jgi:hypothetical protein
METRNHDFRIATYWERLAIWVVGILLAICAWLFIGQKAQIETLEVKVQTLQVDKVSRQELKDLEDRLYKRMDGMKGDIIDRIDWYFAGRKSRAVE